MSQQAETGKKGFFYGYVIVALAFIINLMLGGTLYTFSVFFEPLSSQFGWTRAATSGAFSLFMFLHGFLYILTGRLNDRFGPRIVLSGCGLFMGIGYLLMSLTGAIWHVYLFYGVVIAIGMSGGYVPLTSTVTRWFAGAKRRGLMVGISVAGVGMGTMIVPPLANWLIATYGWQTSYVVIGIAVLVVIIAAAQVFKRAPEAVIQSTDESGGTQEVVTNIREEGFSLREAARTRQFWLLGIAYFGFGLFLQAIMVHIVLHTTGLGIPSSTAASIFIAIGGLSVVGRISLGSAADRIGNRLILIGSFVLMAVAFSWVFVANEMWMLYIFAGVFGFAYGGLVSTQSPIIADLFGMRSHGVILGVIVSIITCGAAVGPVMAGAIFDVTGSYNIAFIVCLVFSISGIILSLLLKPVTEGGEK